MRRASIVLLANLLLACGSPSGPGEPAEGTEPDPAGSPAPEAAPEPERSEESAHEVPSEPAEAAAATAACEHVRPCIEAFIAVAPADLAAAARTALEQLDVSLAESSAREPACRAALASYREDLTSRELEVPDACR